MTGCQPSLLMYGDFRWDRLAASYRRAFAELDAEVEPVDVREMRDLLAPWARSRAGHRLSRLSLRLRRLAAREWNANVIHQARVSRPDLVLIVNGEFLMPETIASLRSSSTPVFIFHADNPFPPHANSRPEYVLSSRECDAYLVWSLSLATRLRSAGARTVHYLPFAWDPEVFPHLGSVPPPEHEVVFVGGWDTEREQMLEDVARQFDLKIWGPDYWGQRTRPRGAVRACWQGRELPGPEAARVCVAASISLNIMRSQNLPDGVNMRNFELPGAGAFQLSTRTTGAVDIFPEGRSGAYFGSNSECVRQVDHYLRNVRQRREIATAAHALVSSSHRYVHRARHVIEWYRRVTKSPEEVLST